MFSMMYLKIMWMKDKLESEKPDAKMWFVKKIRIFR